MDSEMDLDTTEGYEEYIQSLCVKLQADYPRVFETYLKDQDDTDKLVIDYLRNPEDSVDVILMRYIECKRDLLCGVRPLRSDTSNHTPMHHVGVSDWMDLDVDETYLASEVSAAVTHWVNIFDRYTEDQITAFYQSPYTTESESVYAKELRSYSGDIASGTERWLRSRLARHVVDILSFLMYTPLQKTPRAFTMVPSLFVFLEMLEENHRVFELLMNFILSEARGMAALGRRLHVLLGAVYFTKKRAECFVRHVTSSLCADPALMDAVDGLSKKTCPPVMVMNPPPSPKAPPVAETAPEKKESSSPQTTFLQSDLLGALEQKQTTSETGADHRWSTFFASLWG
jgi:hypothetical protein